MWIFEPIYKHPVWAGHRILQYKNAPYAPAAAVGESWELSDVDGNLSIVADGPDAGCTLRKLIEQYGDKLTGRAVLCKYGNRFPLLFKLIDTDADLSIQVHPNDCMAQTLGHPFGKHEMWMVIDALPGARLACGFNREINPAEFTQLAATGEILHALRYTEVKPGDAFLIPAGRIHAIGAGILLAEIQQSSNDTFRIFDYHRMGTDGKPRDLHITQAAEALNFSDISGRAIAYNSSATVASVVDLPQFSVNRICSDQAPVVRDYSRLDSFVVLMMLRGAGRLTTASDNRVLRQGETALIPASDNSLRITPLTHGFTALETFIR